MVGSRVDFARCQVQPCEAHKSPDELDTVVSINFAVVYKRVDTICLRQSTAINVGNGRKVRRRRLRLWKPLRAHLPSYGVSYVGISYAVVPTPYATTDPSDDQCDVRCQIPPFTAPH
jgi:hypothetical protein